MNPLAENKADVVVIGAGLGGLIAALTAAEEGADVILLSRGPLGFGTNSVLANGIFTNISESYDKDRYVKDILSTGKGINSIERVRSTAAAMPSAFDFLQAIGLEFVTKPDIRIVKTDLPHVIRGIPLMKTLETAIRRASSLRYLTGFYVTDILTDRNSLWGVKGFSAEGENRSIAAPAVILATGGAGALYGRNDNQKTIVGQGYRLASKAGLALRDMEFVQFYPLVLSEPGFPGFIVPSPYPKELRLVSGDGKDLIDAAGAASVADAIHFSRDVLSRLVFESEASGTFLDYSGVPSEWWELAPFAPEMGARIRRKPVAVSSGAHFFMGGVKIDDSCMTDLPGLFACGEITWGLHGANRRGGNALTECIVSGRAAGRGGADYAAQGTAKDEGGEECPFAAYASSSSMERLRRLKANIGTIAWKRAGIVRNENGMKEGLKETESVAAEIASIIPASPRERRILEDLASAAFVLRAVLTAGLARKESRGAFFRADHPREDDNWRCNSRTVHDEATGLLTVDHSPAIHE
ncbi:MAG: FAD-binding protein [Deltaproteobacteria bacterium]|nr:FAD-binding protein [Deltaproteobacteria bacterium]